jgi:uncharacterized protein Yka (UPF0111/DUF47 family)
MSSVSLIDGHMDYTDDEIIKMLECCINDNCNNCPETFGNCELTAMRNALDLLKRQKAEIERLEDKLDTIKQELVETIPMIQEDIKTAKAEAVKEVVNEILSPFEGQAYLSKRDLEIIVKNLAQYY